MDADPSRLRDSADEGQGNGAEKADEVATGGEQSESGCACSFQHGDERMTPVRRFCAFRRRTRGRVEQATVMRVGYFDSHSHPVSKQRIVRTPHDHRATRSTPCDAHETKYSYHPAASLRSHHTNSTP